MPHEPRSPKWAALMSASLAVALTLGCEHKDLTGPPAFPGPRANVASTAADHYYASPLGVDVNPCSAVAPCYTMQRVSELLTPGDTAHFAPGNYTWVTTERLMASGDSTARVTYISDAKWGAKISGSCRVIWNGGDYVDLVGFDVTGPPNCVNWDNPRR